MHIKFVDQHLAKKLASHASIVMNFGKLSLKIEMRLSELVVAKTLSEISPNPPPRRHKMSNMVNTWAVDLSKNWRMLLKSDGEDNPERVTEVTIIGIVDYH